MDIYIYVYTFNFLLFFKFEHTEVRYGPVFIGYGPSGLRVSNISNRNMKLKTIIHAGVSEVTLEEFYGFLRELRIVLESRQYCLFFWNCRHISLKILRKLNGGNSQGKSVSVH